MAVAGWPLYLRTLCSQAKQAGCQFTSPVPSWASSFPRDVEFLLLPVPAWEQQRVSIPVPPLCHQQRVKQRSQILQSARAC